MDKHTIIVQSTDNYDKFVNVKGNREIKSYHVKRLKDSLHKKNLMLYNPIIVTSKWEVIDGQHRLKACRDLGIPVFYTIVPQATLDDIMLLNANHKSWTYKDYMEAYCSKGLDDYLVAEDFRLEYKFGYTLVIELLAGRGAGESFKNGTFEIKNFERARKIAEHIMQFETAFEEGFRRARFIRAIQTIMTTVKQYDPQRMIQKLAYQSTKLKRCETRDEYMRQLEDIYNHRVIEKDKVRLF